MTTTQPDRGAILALLDTDPAAGLLAAADLREQRANAATPGPWHSGGHDDSEGGCGILGGGVPGSAGERGLAFTTAFTNRRCCGDAEHIAAEANPAHALAEAALWRLVADDHGTGDSGEVDFGLTCHGHAGLTMWPCDYLEDAVAAARAYLGGAQ